MGLLWSKALRPLRSFNAENRAHRAISLEKPLPAPKFEASVRQLEMVLRDHPDEIERLSRKDGPLDDRLKRVFVTSEEPEANVGRHSSSRPLPVDRTPPPYFDFNVLEPETAPPGFIKQSDVFKLLADHKAEPHLNVLESAIKYGIDREDVENLVKYYGSFRMIEGKKKKGEKHLLPGIFYEPIGGKSPLTRVK